MSLLQVIGVTSQSSKEDLDALLRTSDVISLHVPLTPKTKGMLGKAGKEGGQAVKAAPTAKLLT
jgi:hypothetical protein